MNLVSRGIRNAFRNSIRTGAITLILGLSIGLSLTMLVANKAVENKITSVKSSIGNTISVSAAGIQGFQGGGNPLDQAKITKLASLVHVSSVTETISDQLRNTDGTTPDGTTTSANTSLTSAIDAGTLGQRFGGGGASTSATDSTSSDSTATPPSGASFSFTPPISAYGTTDATKLEGTTTTLKSGTTISGTTDKDVALVGSTLATKNSLKVGSTFTAYGETITVAGIFDTGTSFSNNAVLFSLPTLQRLSSQSGELTSATVTVDSVSNIDSVTTAVKSALGSAADVTNSKDTIASAIEPLNSVKTISTFSLIGAVVAGAVIIFLTMIMIVRERMREIGVVKAIGGSNLRIAGEFMVESMTLALLGVVVGLVIGVVGGQPVTKLLVSNSSNTSSSVNTSFQGGPGAAPGGSAITTRQRPTGGSFRALRDNQAVRGISNVKAEIGLSILGYGLAAAVLIAAVGSGLAAAMISRIRPSTVMRSE
jgi:putative ABC transport system permease protein